MKKILIYTSMLTVMFIAGCKKDWLDAKPDLSLAVPTTIADFQALLDNPETSVPKGMPFNNSQGGFAELSGDDYTVSDVNWAKGAAVYRNLYTWASDIYQGDESTSDWSGSFQRIYVCNLVLEGLEKIASQGISDQAAWNIARGTALFQRAYNHFYIAQLFCKPYVKSSASNDLGIPVRLTSDFNIPATRVSVQTTYDLIIADLKASLVVLPEEAPSRVLYKLRPNKASVNAMLARTYLAMGDYENAYAYANASLTLYSSLIDYNTISAPGNTAPFAQFNDEVLFHTQLGIFLFLVQSYNIPVPALLNLYEANDLRRSLFYSTVSGHVTFKGSYGGAVFAKFSGLATDEVYLIRAECLARKGDIINGQKDLNTLLKNRYKTGTFNDLNFASADELLGRVLQERRKELCFRGIRWTDLRRLNLEPKFQVTLRRTVNGTTHELPPNDSRYVLPIPPDVIRLSSLQQNPR